MHLIKGGWVAGRSLLNVLGAAYLDGWGSPGSISSWEGCAVIVNMYSGIFSG